MIPLKFAYDDGARNTHITLPFKPSQVSELHIKFRQYDSRGYFNNNAVFGARAPYAESCLSQNASQFFFSWGTAASAGIFVAHDLEAHEIFADATTFTFDNVTKNKSTSFPNFNCELYSFNSQGSITYGAYWEIYFADFVADGVTYKLRPYLDDNTVIFYDEENDVKYIPNSGTLIAGPLDAPFYTVNFNSNGGEGSMSPQEIIVDTSTALSLCQFSKTDFDFLGWATSQSGVVVYSDGEEVINIAEEGQSITLYAVWSPKPPHFILQYNQSDADHLDKDITNIHDLVGIFRDDCTIEDPVVLLEGNPDLLTGVNYFTIPKFNRSYFLTGQRIVRTNLIEITGHVDVLSSFKTYIRQQTAIVKRQETNKAYNLYIDDSSLRSYQNPIVLTQNFPQGFNGHSFILVTAGIEGTTPVSPPGDFTLDAVLDETTNNINLIWTPSSDVEYYMVTRREATAPPPFNFFYNIVNKTTNTSYEDRPLFLREFEYQVVAVNKYGNTFSNIAVPAPSEFRIIQQPVDYTGAIGETATFTINTNRVGATYQWQVYRNNAWSDMPSYTSPIFSAEITATRLTYIYRCQATYEGTTLTSMECRMIEG